MNAAPPPRRPGDEQFSREEESSPMIAAPPPRRAGDEQSSREAESPPMNAAPPPRRPGDEQFSREEESSPMNAAPPPRRPGDEQPSGEDEQPSGEEESAPPIGEALTTPAPQPDETGPGPAPRAALPARGPSYTWLRGPARAALLPIAAGLLACAFPQPGWSLLSLPALGVVFALLATAAPGRAAREGFVAGVVFFGLLLRWFAAVLLVFTALGAALSFGAVAGAGIIEGVFTALLGWTMGRLGSRFGPGLALAAAPPLWVGYEALRSVFPVAFPWGTLAAAWSGVPGAPAAAAVVGSQGVSLVLATGSALCGAWLVSRGARRRVVAGLLVWAGMVLALYVAGRRVQDALPPAPPVRVAVLQGALPADADRLDELRTYERLTGDAAQAGARIVIWPESAHSFRLDADSAFRARIEELARVHDADLVLGSITARPGGGYFNSDALVRGDSGLAQVQPKRQLVPFGEYLPLRLLFGRVPAIAWEMGEDFQAGTDPVVLRGARADYGALVCFEGVFPALARDLCEEGASVLVNTTNDSWFGWSSGPYQHLAHTILRSAETGRPLLRAANSGISVIVNREGQVLRRLGLGEQGLLVADVVPGTSVPPGAAVGWGVAIGCAMVGSAALLAALFCRRRHGGPVE